MGKENGKDTIFRQPYAQHVQAFLSSAPTFVPPIELLSPRLVRVSESSHGAHRTPSGGSSHRVEQRVTRSSALCTHHLFSISIRILPTAIPTPANSGDEDVADDHEFNMNSI